MHNKHLIGVGKCEVYPIRKFCKSKLLAGARGSSREDNVNRRVCRGSASKQVDGYNSMAAT